MKVKNFFRHMLPFHRKNRADQGGGQPAAGVDAGANGGAPAAAAALATPVPPPPPPVDRAALGQTAAKFRAELDAMPLAPGGVKATDVPFRLSFEVKWDPGAASRYLADTQWSVERIDGDNHNSGGDCSHKTDGGGSSFVRLVSPPLTIGGGGLDSISEVMARLQENRIETGSTGAMRLRIPRATLDDAATTKWMALYLAHEDVLYTLAQNGGAGRDFNHKSQFAATIGSFLQAPEPPTVEGWSTALNSRTGGINSHHSPTDWELRFYDSSTDPAAVEANVALLAGMMAAASAGRGEAPLRHQARADKAPVSLQRWDALMRATVGSGAISEQLRQQFLAAGGRFSPQGDVVPSDAPRDGALQADIKGAIVEARQRMASAFVGQRDGVYVNEKARLGAVTIDQLSRQAPDEEMKRFATFCKDVADDCYFAPSKAALYEVALEALEHGTYRDAVGVSHVMRRMLDGLLDSRDTSGKWHADKAALETRYLDYLEKYEQTPASNAWLRLARAVNEAPTFAASRAAVTDTLLEAVHIEAPPAAGSFAHVLGQMVDGSVNAKDPDGEWQPDKFKVMNAALPVLREALPDATSQRLLALFEAASQGSTYATTSEKHAHIMLDALARGAGSDTALARMATLLVDSASKDEDVEVAQVTAQHLQPLSQDARQSAALDALLAGTLTPGAVSGVASAAFAAWALAAPGRNR
jgi:hypothetical protein